MMGADRWPCGHPKHPKNIVAIGDGRQACGLCRSATCQKSRTPDGRFQRYRLLPRAEAEQIILAVACETGIPFDDITSNSRAREKVAARHLVYARMHETGASKDRIALLMQCTRANVIYGIRRAQGRGRIEARREHPKTRLSDAVYTVPPHIADFNRQQRERHERQKAQAY